MFEWYEKGAIATMGHGGKKRTSVGRYPFDLALAALCGNLLDANSGNGPTRPCISSLLSFALEDLSSRLGAAMARQCCFVSRSGAQGMRLGSWRGKVDAVGSNGKERGWRFLSLL